MFSKFAEKIGLFDVLAPRASARPKIHMTSEDSVTSVDENKLKRRRLDAQFKAEKEAEERGPKFFAKKQRVRYFNKVSNSICDAVVVGVHFDDGPQDPYYTIKYKKQCEEILEDGTKKTTLREVEKQTNPDRLSRVPWEEEKAWKVLSNGRC